MSPSHKHVPDKCPAVREVLNRVGDKWSVQIVALLGGGKKRFSELRHTIEGISQRMLTLTLKGLERDGLITSEWETPAAGPARKVYRMTDKGTAELAKRKEVWNAFARSIDRVIGGEPDAQPV